MSFENHNTNPDMLDEGFEYNPEEENEFGFTGGFEYDGEEEESQDEPEQDDVHDGNAPRTEAPKDNDEVIGGLSDMFKQYGIDKSVDEYKGKGLTVEQAREAFVQAVAEKALSAIDPSLAAAMKHGIQPEAYRAQVQEVDNLLALDNITLAKDAMFRQIWEVEEKLGTLPEDPKEAEAYVFKLTEDKAKAMGAKIEAIGLKHREGLVQQKEALPKQLQEAFEKEREEKLNDFNKKVEVFVSRDDVKQYLSTGGIIPFEKEEEKTAFSQYAKDMLSFNKEKGTTLLMEKLSDPTTAMHVLRSLHAIEKGYFGKIEKRAVREAFNKLDGFADKAGQGAGGSKGYFDTSKPHQTPI
jgi:hypothetical protein